MRKPEKKLSTKEMVQDAMRLLVDNNLPWIGQPVNYPGEQKAVGMQVKREQLTLVIENVTELGDKYRVDFTLLHPWTAEKETGPVLIEKKSIFPDSKPRPAPKKKEEKKKENAEVELAQETVEKIARVAHETNRAYCQTLGDDSQVDWLNAPDWQKKSCIDGVLFHAANPDASESASHDNWMKMKVEDGWVYGEVKDPEKKTHPCIVPFDQLPKEQQLKDRLFHAVVKALLP